MGAIATTSNTQQQFLTFRLDEVDYAVEVEKTREILDLVSITRMPQMPAAMLGVINLRGGAVPVIDLRRHFGLPATERTRENCIILLEVVANGATMVVGALADAVSEVLELPESEIEPPPRLGMQLHRDFIQGMGKKDGKFLIILDLDRVFSATELDLLQDALPGAA